MTTETTDPPVAADQNQVIAHTPGPWIIKYDTNIFARRTDVGHVGGICTTGTHGSSHVDCGPENQANARLIAVAPEMLELARSVVAAWDGKWNDGSEADPEWKAIYEESKRLISVV